MKMTAPARYFLLQTILVVVGLACYVYYASRTGPLPPKPSAAGYHIEGPHATGLRMSQPSVKRHGRTAQKDTPVQVFDLPFQLNLPPDGTVKFIDCSAVAGKYLDFVNIARGDRYKDVTEDRPDLTPYGDAIDADIDKLSAEPICGPSFETDFDHLSDDLNSLRFAKEINTWQRII